MRCPRNKDFEAMLRVFGSYVNFGHFLFACPYRYDPALHRLEFDKRLRYRIMFSIYALVIYSYVAFLNVQGFRALFTTEIEPKYKPRFFSMAIAFALWSPAILIAMRQFGSFASLFNALVDTEVHLREKYQIQSGSKAIKYVFRTLVFYGIAGPVIVSRAIIKDPKTPHMLSSVLFPDRKKHWGLIPIFLIHWLKFFFGAIPSLTAAMMILLFISVLLPGLQKVKCSQKSAPDFETLKHVYNLLATVEKIGMSVLGPWTLFIVIKYIVTIISCLFGFVAIGYAGASVSLSLVMLFLVSLTNACGQLNVSCESAMRTWAPMKHDVVSSKWQRAQRSLRVNIGSFFYFDRGIYLTFANIILTNSVSLILAYNQAKLESY